VKIYDEEMVTMFEEIEGKRYYLFKAPMNGLTMGKKMGIIPLPYLEV